MFSPRKVISRHWARSASFQLATDAYPRAIARVATALLVRRLLWNKVVEQLLIGLAASLVIAGRMHNDVEALVGSRREHCRKLP